MHTILLPEELSLIEHDIPYVYEIHKQGFNLAVYGSAHLGPSNTSDAAAINDALSVFRPSLIIVESIDGLYYEKPLAQRQDFLRASSFASVSECLRFGEVGIAFDYAIRTGQPIISVEPLIAQQKDMLLRDGISPAQVEAFFVLRTYASLRSHKGEDLASAVQRTCSNIEPGTTYSGLSPEQFIKEVQHRFPDLAFDSANFIEAFDPTVMPHRPEYKWTNGLARRLTIMRDRAVCSFIISKVELEPRIFVLYGASHAVAWEEALLRNIPNARKYNQSGGRRLRS